MIVRRDEKLIDVPLDLAETEIAAGTAEIVVDYTGIREVDITEDVRYGLVRDGIGYSVTQDPDRGFIPRDPSGFPLSEPLPLYAVARAYNRDHAARQAALGAMVYAGRPIPEITDGSEALPPGRAALGREPMRLTPGPRPAGARTND